MSDNKLISRIEKLLRLAAPTSGATEPERVSAALEASRLFAQGGFVVGEREQKVVPKPRGRAPVTVVAQPQRTPPRQPTPPPPGWHKSIAIFDSCCIDPGCGGPIQAGDSVWSRVVGGIRIEYLHCDGQGDCAW